LRIGRYADGCSASLASDDHPHCLRTVSITIERRGMLSVWIKPTICATPITGGKIRVGIIHTGIHIGNDNALSGKSQSPKRRGIDERYIGLRVAIRGDNINFIRGNGIHIGMPGKFIDDTRRSGN